MLRGNYYSGSKIVMCGNSLLLSNLLLTILLHSESIQTMYFRTVAFKCAKEYSNDTSRCYFVRVCQCTKMEMRKASNVGQGAAHPYCSLLSGHGFVFLFCV